METLCVRLSVENDVQYLRSAVELLILDLSPGSGVVASLNPTIDRPHGEGKVPGTDIAIAVCSMYNHVSSDIKEREVGTKCSTT